MILVPGASELFKEFLEVLNCELECVEDVHNVRIYSLELLLDLRHLIRNSIFLSHERVTDRDQSVLQIGKVLREEHKEHSSIEFFSTVIKDLLLEVVKLNIGVSP